MIPYKVIKSNRKTLTITVDDNAQVIVKTPLKTTKTQIEDFLTREQSWIEKKLLIAQKQIQKFADLADNSHILYMGEKYKVLKHCKKKAYFDGNVLYANDGDAIKKWLKKQAQDYFSEYVYQYCKKLDLFCDKVRISDAKSKWGSCNSKKVLSFNFRVIMLPPQTINAIIIHEVAHLKHMNHSNDFYALVNQHCPNYNTIKKNLKEYRMLMSFHRKGETN